MLSLLAAAALARQSSANSATKDLKNQAPAVAAELDSFGKQFRNGSLTRLTARERATQIRRLVARVLAISHSSVVTVQPDGTIVEGATGLLGLAANPAAQAAAAALALPDGVSQSDLDAQKLLAGQQQSGQDGDTVFVARPLTQIGANTPVVVLSQKVDTQPLGRAGGFLIVTGALALVVAALVSAYLARRMTRPLAAMQETAGRIAEGDLAARVRLQGSYPDDELASLARSINAMANDLETARGHERAFLLSVSHDLRTPLTSIKGYVGGDRRRDRRRPRAADPLGARSSSPRPAGSSASSPTCSTSPGSTRTSSRSTPQPLDARRVVGETVAGFLPVGDASGAYDSSWRAASRCRSTPIPSGSRRSSPTSSRTR